MKQSLRVTTFLLAASLALANNSRLSRELQNMDPSATVNVIVQFRQAPTETQEQKVRARGGSKKAALALLNAGLYTIPASGANDLSDDPDVTYISRTGPCARRWTIRIRR